MRKGFAAIYMVYSFFLIFIVMLLSVFMINNYKRRFLNSLKEDIKNEVSSYHLEIKTPPEPDLLDETMENSLENS